MSPQKVSLPQRHDRSVRSPFISVSVLSGGDTSGRGPNGVIKSWHQRLLGDPDGQLLELSRLEHRPSNDLWCWMFALPGCQNNETKKGGVYSEWRHSHSLLRNGISVN